MLDSRLKGVEKKEKLLPVYEMTLPTLGKEVRDYYL